MHNTFYIFLVFIITIISCDNKESKVYQIANYGAKNDTIQLSTSAIQKAIDACSKTGGIVKVPKGNYVVGTIKLKSNVELHLEEGASILGSHNLEDYATDIQGAIEMPVGNKCVIYAENAKNIKITGKGTINGRGYETFFPVRIDKKLTERPMLLRFVNCTNVVLNEVSLINASSWCTHMVDCIDVSIKNVTINSDLSVNNDGFDLDGCKNVNIEDCNIFSGDDSICLKSTTSNLCEKIVVKNCRVVSHTSAFKTGTSSRGGFKNITIENCDFSDTKMGVIKLLAVDGGILENVKISNIKMENVEGPIFIRLGNRGRLYNRPTEQVYDKNASSEGAPVGRVKDIHISNIKATVNSDIQKRCGIMISGIPDYPIENITLENIQVSYPGGGTIKESENIVLEDIARYPEQFFFGVLPSWGAYVRHAKNVTFKNVKMEVRTKDLRKKIITEDVAAFREL